MVVLRKQRSEAIAIAQCVDFFVSQYERQNTGQTFCRHPAVSSIADNCTRDNTAKTNEATDVGLGFEISDAVTRLPVTTPSPKALVERLVDPQPPLFGIHRSVLINGGLQTEG